jgi:hypothetical protein
MDEVVNGLAGVDPGVLLKEEEWDEARGEEVEGDEEE